MRYPVNLELFDQTSHTPSLFTLEQSMGPGHGKIRDYCIPVNSYFPTTEMMSRWQAAMPRVLKYYPADNRQIADSVSRRFDLDPDNVVMFNGATELLSWLAQLLIKGRLVTPIPTFGRWTDVPLQVGRDVIPYVRRAENEFQLDITRFAQRVRRSKATSCVVCNPNNPTGACLTRSDLLRLLGELSDLELIVIDESFLDFCDLQPFPSVVDLVGKYRNLLVMKSLGKNLGLHGLRMGYSVSNAKTAQLLRAHVPHWNLNSMAELVLTSLDQHWGEYQKSRQRVIADRQFLYRQLQALPGVRAFPSRANFVYCDLGQSFDGDQLRNRLLTEHGFLIRHCGNKWGATAQQLRLVARPKFESMELVRAIEATLRPAASDPGRRRIGSSSGRGYESFPFM